MASALRICLAGAAPTLTQIDGTSDLILRQRPTPAGMEVATRVIAEGHVGGRPAGVPPDQYRHNILKTARAVMGTFAETRPDDYVAWLEASPSEWMTITDDSLSNELERELLTSAAAMSRIRRIG